MENKRFKIEIGDIFREHQEYFQQQNKLCPEQVKAINAISNCRTSVLGGHINQCDHCGHTMQAYSSCRNRHCPKCQYLKQVQWADKLKSNLPPVRYFHVVFTMPECLNALFYINQKTCYSILFSAAAEALKRVTLMPNLIGAETGAVAVLHTWGQTLTYHPHIHMIVPAGGLSSDGTEWLRTPKNFLLPVKVLSKVFRGILCRMIEKQWENNVLLRPEQWNVIDFSLLKKKLYEKKWNINSRTNFASPDRVIDYLANYTHRVAISNDRLTGYDGEKIFFRYKDYRTGLRGKPMQLTVMEFMRRFMQHILPCGFCKIRYYGLFAAVNANSKQGLVFTLVAAERLIPVLEGLNAYEVYREITGDDPSVCPKCKQGRMINTMCLSLKKTG